MHGSAAAYRGNIADLTSTGWDTTTDFTLSFTARRQGAGVNLASGFQVQMGGTNDVNIGLAINLDFSAGDNAGDICTSFALNEASGGVTSFGPIQFTAATPVPIILQRIGGNLTVTIDGVVLGTFACSFGANTEPIVLVESNPGGNLIVQVFDDFLLTVP